MNLLLLEESDLVAGGLHARVCGHRAFHLLQVAGVSVDSVVAAGLLGGAMGTATVVAVEPDSVTLALRLDRPPPPRFDVRLVLALPRPKSLRRIVQGAAAMGVAEVHLIHSWKVEKSYWHSPFVTAENLRRDLITGIEQSRDTVLPALHMHRRFKPFVEDALPKVGAGTIRLLGHVLAERVCPTAVAEPLTLVVGPEAGFTDYEVAMLVAGGFTPVTLGPRTLRVEQAIPALLGRLAAVRAGCE